MKNKETVKKNDFIEIEFTARVENGEVFDTNIQSELKKISPEAEAKPLVICIGQSMVIEGFDRNLENKETEKEYEIRLSPREAFGIRDAKLMKTIPTKIFLEKNIMPRAGLIINLDGFIARIIAVSGGRAIVDFNNPLASKTIIYKFKIKRIIQDTREKINALMDFFFKKRFKFEIKDKKILIQATKEEQTFISPSEKKFKEILNLEMQFVESSEKQEKNNKLD